MSTHIFTHVDEEAGDIDIVDPISGEFFVCDHEPGYPYIRASVIDRLVEQGRIEAFK